MVCSWFILYADFSFIIITTVSDSVHTFYEFVTVPIRIKVSGQPLGPKVTVSDVTTSSVKLTMSSEYDRDTVSYYVLYRKLKKNDDEKEEEMKEVDIAKNSDCTTISTEAGSNYEVHVNYLLNGLLPSESKTVQMTTTFQFDPARKHSKISLVNSGKSLIVTDSGYYSVVSKNIISCKTMSKVTYTPESVHMHSENLQRRAFDCFNPG